MRYTILISIFILFLFSCKKNTYTTAPQLKYKSVNTKSLRQGQILTFVLSFTDAEGDVVSEAISDSSLFVKKVVTKCAGSSFDQYYQIPKFPTAKNQSGEILVSYGYNVTGYQSVQTPQCNKNDTAVFKFVLRDKAKNKSDTAVSDPIVIFN